MEMDLPDVNPEPFMQPPPAAHEEHPTLSEHGLAEYPCPMDMNMPDFEGPEAPAEQLKSPSPDVRPEDVQPDNMPLTPPLMEEDYLPPAAQVCTALLAESARAISWYTEDGHLHTSEFALIATNAWCQVSTLPGTRYTVAFCPHNPVTVAIYSK